MRKSLFITYLFLLVLIFQGCGTNEPVGEKNIKGFIKELYQVENTDEYQKLVEKIDQYLEEKGKGSGEQLITIDEKDGAELYKPFTSKYKKYCTEAALQTLIGNGYITRYDRQAWEEKCQFLVKEIKLEQDKNKTQYYYTVQVEKRLSDGTNQLETREGITKLNEKGLIDWFKMTKP